MEQPVATRSGDPQKNTLAMISMITGIVSMVLGILIIWIPFGTFMGMAISIAAIVMGILGKASEYRGFAIAGICCGAFSGLIYGVLIVFSLLFGLVIGGLFAS